MMKPDPDMMMQAMSKSKDALNAIARFQLSAGFQYGRDGSHAGAYRALRDLADDLQSIGSKMHNALLDADERLTPDSRTTNDKE